MEALGAKFVYLASLVGFDPDTMTAYGPRVLNGLGVTILIVALSMPIGGLIACPLAMARMSDNKILSSLAACYIYFFRGTPLLAQQLNRSGLSAHEAKMVAYARIYQGVQAQAGALAYIDTFMVLSIGAAIMFFLAFILRKNSPGGGGRVLAE